MQEDDAPMLPGMYLAVRKSNALCRSIMRAKTIYDRQLSCIVASRINSTDKDFQTYEIDAHELYGARYGSQTVKSIDAMLKDMITRAIGIRENGNNYPTFYSLFSMLEFDPKEGVIRARFDPGLKPHYLELKDHYAQWNYLDYMGIHGKHCQALYEVLMSWQSEIHYLCQLPFLHEVLGSPPSLRKNFGEFKRRVLEPGRKQFADKGCPFTYKEKKIGKKVVGIYFKFLPLPEENPVVIEDEDLVTAISKCSAENPRKYKEDCGGKYRKDVKKRYQGVDVGDMCNTCQHHYGFGAYPLGDRQKQEKAQQEKLVESYKEWRNEQKVLEQPTA